MDKKYYIYILLDPRKKGKYTYGNITLDHEPFYVGKGSGDRMNQHIRNSSINSESNNIKLKIINEIIIENLKPIPYKLINDLSEENSYLEEYNIINIIGKIIDGSGPLTNIKCGGYGFTSEDAKLTWMSDYTREKRILGLKNWWRNLTDEDKLNYSENKKGILNPFFGKSHTDDFKLIRSDKYSGNGNPMYGRTGEKSPHFGKKHNEKTKNKKSISMKKYYSELSPEKQKEKSEKASKSNLNNPKLCGENNKNSKLTNNDVILMREYYSNNKNQGHTKTINDLIEKYKMGYSSIDSIIKRNTWKHL